jgi:hypothetical protein
MRNPLILACAIASAIACGGGGGGNSDGSITIENASSHVLYEVRVAPINQVSWGPNLLPDRLFTNERLTISVACNTYDVMVVDDLDRPCTLGNLDLCFADKLWVIDNATLRNCGYY